jgi:hypothetical protein
MSSSPQFPSTPPGPALPAAVELAPPLDDMALGFECAYPFLQIERWGLEAGPQATVTSL